MPMKAMKATKALKKAMKAMKAPKAKKAMKATKGKRGKRGYWYDDLGGYWHFVEDPRGSGYANLKPRRRQSRYR